MWKHWPYWLRVCTQLSYSFLSINACCLYRSQLNPASQSASFKEKLSDIRTHLHCYFITNIYESLLTNIWLWLTFINRWVSLLIKYIFWTFILKQCTYFYISKAVNCKSPFASQNNCITRQYTFLQIMNWAHKLYIHINYNNLCIIWAYLCRLPHNFWIMNFPLLPSNPYTSYFFSFLTLLSRTYVLMLNRRGCPFPILFFTFLPYILKQFLVHSKTEKELQRFPVNSSPNLHSLPHHQHPPPERCIYSTQRTYSDTLLSPRVLNSHSRSFLVLCIQWVWKNVYWHISIIMVYTEFFTALEILCTLPSQPSLPLIPANYWYFHRFYSCYQVWVTINKAAITTCVKVFWGPTLSSPLGKY